jgi:LPS export ABC transporter protein LptC
MIGVIVGVVVVAIYRERSTPTFHLKSEHTQLSNEVVAEVTGYERLETDGDTRKYYIKASTARTFSDNHQELDNIFIQTYDPAGNPADKMSAEKGLYIPEENKNFTAYLSGSVAIETRDSLIVRTSHIVFSKQNETAEADEPVEFERENIKGSSRSALVRIADKRIELDRNVEINVVPDSGDSGELKGGSLTADWASYDHAHQKVELKGNVSATMKKPGEKDQDQTITGNANRANATLVGQDNDRLQLSQLELFENVLLKSSKSDEDAATINADYGRYDRPADRFDLHGSVHILTTQRGDPTEARAAEARYWQTSGKIELFGAAEIAQGINYAKGDSLDGVLGPDRRLRNCSIRGNAFVRQTTTERAIQVSAAEMNALFSDDALLQAANGRGNVVAEIVPAGSAGYSKVSMSTPESVKLEFKGEGALAQMRSYGRTTVNLSVPDNQPDSANKRLTADSVSTTFDETGKNIKRAEAVGDAELFVEPLRAAPQNYKTSIYAARFDCEFFPTGNNAKICKAGPKTKTVRVPTVNSDDSGNQILISDYLAAAFGNGSNDVERLDASGAAKFTQLDRNATAAEMSFTQADQVVRMRGGEPTVWDSSARIKASEIDWNTSDQRSFYRGGVSTTYYSRKQMNDSAPFGSSDKPVFVTSDSAEFDHRQHIGVYVGNARGWQGSNYIRGNRFTIKEQEGIFLADGNVQSLLYDVKQKRNAAEASVPVSASAAAMTYARDSKILSYRTNVDIRQGTDRIVTNSADVFLDDKNEVTKTIAENGVTITQPGRRATGDWAQYIADDEVAVIRGNPARVEDGENGTSQGAQITVYLRDNRVIGESKAPRNSSGRIRSVYNVRNKE